MRSTWAVRRAETAQDATRGADAYTGEGGRSRALTGPRQRPEPYEDITDYTVTLLRLILLALLIGFNGGPL